MRAYERFLRYVAYDTASDAASQTCPSTSKQLALARALVKELQALGLADARMDEWGYVYASLPANCAGQDVIGLIAHMDTVDVVPSDNVRPSLVPYKGGPLVLQNGDVLDPQHCPGLAARAGKTLIVTDGNTLLGADDKAGVAEIMTAAGDAFARPSIPHGAVKVAFTPDEEIGRGRGPVRRGCFPARTSPTRWTAATWAASEFENFNAASAIYTIHGVSAHPGSAKGLMVNANSVACELNALFPPDEVPERTEGYEAFSTCATSTAAWKRA